MKKNPDKKLKTLVFDIVIVGGTVPKLTAVSFSVEAYRKALAMIILDELPFRFVMGQGFKQFIKVGQSPM